MEGLLLVDKPAGISSFGVVSKVRWIITQGTRKMHADRGYCNQPNEPKKVCKCKTKVGHTGTLDPAATGLLILAIGKYTKKVPELIKQDKTYEVTMTLGQTSSTGDKEGKITDISDVVPTKESIQTALHKFTGELMQTPPIYSAIKINGQRAYDLARKGKEVVIEPRPVKIYKNELISYSYPIVCFISEVGSGTYIRSLVQDIGENLGTGAYMSDLRRTQIGSFSISSAITLDELNIENIQIHLRTL
jgi:tRNA pseudouridine55 synthase